MPISMPCPGCSAKLKAPDAAAGRTLTCPGCKTPVLIPGAPAPAPPAPARPAASPPLHSPTVQTNIRKTTTSAPPRVTKRQEEEEIFEDFEVLGDDPDALDEVLPITEEGVEELEEVPEDEEGVEPLEEVLDPGDLDEVAPATMADILNASQLLREQTIHIKARKYDVADKMIDQDLRDYELRLPRGGQRLGRAREIRDTATQVGRAFVGSALVCGTVEIREGPANELLGTVSRPPVTPGLLGATHSLEVYDAADRLLGWFEQTGWQAICNKPLNIMSADGRKTIMRVLFYYRGDEWRFQFITPAEQVLAELIPTQRGIAIQWIKMDAFSYHLKFMPSMAKRPRDKLLCLGVAVGLQV